MNYVPSFLQRSNSAAGAYDSVPTQDLEAAQQPKRASTTYWPFGKKAEPEPVPFYARCLKQDRDYKIGFILFAIAIVYMGLAFVLLPHIVLSPYKFTIFYTLSVVFFFISFAYLNGPQSYVVRLFSKENMFFTFLLIGSIIFSFFSSLYLKEYILTLLACLV